MEDRGRRRAVGPGGQGPGSLGPTAIVRWVETVCTSLDSLSFHSTGCYTGGAQKSQCDLTRRIYDNPDNLIYSLY